VTVIPLALLETRIVFRWSEDTSRTRELGTCAEGYGSSCLDYPLTVCVIHNAVDVVFSQMESDDRIRRPCVGTPLEDDHRRFTIYFSNSQSPGQGPAPPIREIRGICKSARKGVGNIESSIRTDQLTNPVPVAAVKTLDIEFITR